MKIQVINPQTGRATKIRDGKVVSVRQASGVYENIPQFIPMDKNTLIRAIRICNEKK